MKQDLSGEKPERPGPSPLWLGLVVGLLLTPIAAIAVLLAVRDSRMMHERRSLVAEITRLGGRAGVPEGGYDLLGGTMSIFVELGNTKVNDTDLARAVSIPAFRFVEQLDLAGTLITDDGVKLLESNRSLIMLNLARTKVTDRGFESLASVPGLNGVDLSATSVSDAGLKAFARRHGPFPYMELKLADTAVTEEAVRSVSTTFAQGNIVYGPSSSPKYMR